MLLVLQCVEVPDKTGLFSEEEGERRLVTAFVWIEWCVNSIFESPESTMNATMLDRLSKERTRRMLQQLLSVF